MKRTKHLLQNVSNIAYGKKSVWIRVGVGTYELQSNFFF